MLLPWLGTPPQDLLAVGEEAQGLPRPCHAIVLYMEYATDDIKTTLPASVIMGAGATESMPGTSLAETFAMPQNSWKPWISEAPLDRGQPWPNHQGVLLLSKPIPASSAHCAGMIVQANLDATDGTIQFDVYPRIVY